MHYYNAVEKYKVLIGRKALKGIGKLPQKERDILIKLIEDLKISGPIQPGYKNYSALGGNKYHCYLSYRWVACWYEEKGKLKIEVYYVGSRESAPY